MVADLRAICLGYVGIGMSAVGSPPMYSYSLPIYTYGLSLTVFELFSWLDKRFRPPVRPFDPDTMNNTALEAIASSSGKDCVLALMTFSCRISVKQTITDLLAQKVISNRLTSPATVVHQ